MLKQLIFIVILLLSIGIFIYTVRRLLLYFSITKKNYPVKEHLKRIKLTLKIAFAQQKILRRPIAGLLHALVFWGFLVVTFGSVEMIIDGITGTERSLSIFGIFYDFMMAAGDIFAYIVLIATGVFIARRIFSMVKRFEGKEMKRISHIDALVALVAIILLMVSLVGMNISYTAMHHTVQQGVYPLSSLLSFLLADALPHQKHLIYEICWWTHIVLIFAFANYLPYSKHFHVFLSIPNVYLSRLQPIGILDNMEDVTKEVKLMLNPETAFSETDTPLPARFGVKDIEDLSWKNYFDSLACTQCGRCTSVCPANITGKQLSPRKIMMNIRQRMNEKAPQLLKKNPVPDDGKSLLFDFITEEELWACTTCNACVQECPVNINHPNVIVDLRRYLVMEEANAPSELNKMFTNIENNGAPWQYSNQDRLLWTK